MEELEDFGCVRIKIPDAPTPPPPLVGSYLAVDFIYFPFIHRWRRLIPPPHLFPLKAV